MSSRCIPSNVVIELIRSLPDPITSIGPSSPFTGVFSAWRHSEVLLASWCEDCGSTPNARNTSGPRPARWSKGDEAGPDRLNLLLLLGAANRVSSTLAWLVLFVLFVVFSASSSFNLKINEIQLSNLYYCPPFLNEINSTIWCMLIRRQKASPLWALHHSRCVEQFIHCFSFGQFTPMPETP